jgi:hypothetical protein
MKRNTFGLIAGLGVLLAAAPLLAHHSFSAEYDSSKPVTLKGIVTKVDWMNPHVYFYLDVETDGKVTNWGLEMGPPNMLEHHPDRHRGRRGRHFGQGWQQASQREIGDSGRLRQEAWRRHQRRQAVR